MSYTEAMARYGSDKPDLRFGMEIVDMTDAVRNSDLRLFTETLQAGGAVKCILAPGCAAYSRKDLDVLTEFVRSAGGEESRNAGLDVRTDLKGTSRNQLKPEEVAEIARITRAKEGDLACIVADKAPAACKALGALRLEFRDRLKLAPPDLLAFGWVVDFPMFEWDEEEKRWSFVHHPFTSPRGRASGQARERSGFRHERCV